MSAPIATFETNTEPGSIKDVCLHCDTLWMLGQQEAILRLCVPDRSKFATPGQMELIRSFSARAARIAATYAEFYLELGTDGRPDLKGRFYWMGLAAFASKQVKCGLDFIPEEPYLSWPTPLLWQVPLRIGKNALGKGNFWLFQDIFVWHWFYRKFPEQFEECAPARNVGACAGGLKKNIDGLPWAEESLAVLNNLQSTEYLMEGFEHIKNYETLSDSQKKLTSQLESLLKIANHEQRMILQPLIYNDLSFQATLDLQAATEWAPFVPVRVAAFSTACDVEDSELRVQMKEGDLYDEGDRMKFITSVAKQYHSLMINRNAYMEGEIAMIAKWSSSP